MTIATLSLNTLKVSRHHLILTLLFFTLSTQCPGAETWKILVDFDEADPELAAQSIARQLDLAVRIDDAVDTHRRISMHATVKDWEMALRLLAVLLEADVKGTHDGFILKPVSKAANDAGAAAVK